MAQTTVATMERTLEARARPVSLPEPFRPEARLMETKCQQMDKQPQPRKNTHINEILDQTNIFQ